VYFSKEFLEEAKMKLQKIILGLMTIMIVVLIAVIYWAWKTEIKLRTATAFVQGYVLEEAVVACEKVASSTPFVWRTASSKFVVGLNSFKGDKGVTVPSFTVYADGVFCDYDPVGKKGSIGSNFLDRN
jgi:hypothetical protein